MYTSDPECLSLPSALPPPRIPFPPSHFALSEVICGRLNFVIAELGIQGRLR